MSRTCEPRCKEPKRYVLKPRGSWQPNLMRLTSAVGFFGFVSPKTRPSVIDDTKFKCGL